MKAKVAFEDDIRRWHYPEEKRFADLLSFVEKSFNLPSKRDFSLRFEDSELDKITISNEQDLLSAFECAAQENWPSLKIFVQIGVTSSVCEPGQKQVRRNDKKKRIECNKASSQPKKRDWEEVIVELLSEKNIKQLLPELVARICSSLHQQVDDGEEIALVTVVPRVLKERQFEHIIQHKFYQQHIANELPTWLSQASFFAYTLLTLNEEDIPKWVSDMLGLISKSLGKGKDNELWRTHVNTWRDQEMKDKSVPVHYRTKCSYCGVNPIRGVRYKCTVCTDYDLCENCEKKSDHTSQHPLLKISRFMCKRNLTQMHFLRLKDDKAGHKHYHYDKHDQLSSPSDRKNKKMPDGEGEKEEEGVARPRKSKAANEKKGSNMSDSSKDNKKEKKKNKSKDKNKDKNKDKKKDNRKELKKMESASHKYGKKQDMQMDMDMNGQAMDKRKNDERMVDLAPQVVCTCGCTMIQTSPVKVYGTVLITCNKCERDCSAEPFIFHCPLRQSVNHPSGYDLCLQCAKYNDNNNNKHDENKESSEDEQTYSSSSFSFSPSPRSQNNEPVEEKKEPVQGMANNDAVQQYRLYQLQYDDFAQCISEMGFHDKNQIMCSLVNNKGDLVKTVAELSSS